MTSHWITSIVVLAAGLLLGEIGGRIARSAMSRPDRAPETREMARPVGTFIFWTGTALGIFASVASSSPRTVRQIPDRSLVLLPNLLVAALFLIGGYALSIVVATAVDGAMPIVE